MHDDRSQRPPSETEDPKMDGDLRHFDEDSAQASLSRVTPQSAFSDTPAYDVRGLMRGGQVALMVLDGQAYSLRITRSGKLILTK